MLRRRALVVLPIALLVAIGAIRAMTFVAPTSHPLRLLEPSFGGHPEALTDRAMREIGAAAGRREAIPASARQAIAEAARKAPLAADPFLVEGTIAEMVGDHKRSERLFLAARDRNPRSQGARYFLADRYLRTNRILPGLVELTALARLSERASQPLAPALAAYARTPGGADELRRFFKRSPAVRDGTLAVLADDPANAPLILSLAPSQGPAPPADWQGRLIQSLLKTGDYAGAETLWRRFAGVANRGLLYNPHFRKSAVPGPFNWQFSSGTPGVAEPAGGGGLDVIYYGREEVTLASQLVRLAPGRYRLAMQVAGSSPAAGLAWAVQCLPANSALAQLPFGPAVQGSISTEFSVPGSGCPAQSLELRGRPGEVSETAQLTISGVKLDPVAGQ
jgi:hypothetical protein